MDRPKDIPEDIWLAAKKPAKMASAAYNTPEMAHAIIARAILREREACRKDFERMAELYGIEA